MNDGTLPPRHGGYRPREKSTRDALDLAPLPPGSREGAKISRQVQPLDRDLLAQVYLTDVSRQT